MRKSLIVGVIFLLVCVTGVQAQLRSDRNVGTTDTSNTPGVGFGQRIAGTWLGTGSFDLDLDCDGVADVFLGIPALDTHMFGVGGSYVVVNPNNPNSILGTWKQTGPRQLTGESIGFGSNPNCTDADDDGVCESFGPLASIFSIKTVVDFDSDYRTATTSFAATVHPPTEDPLDPDAIVNLCTVGAHTAYRKVIVP
jgi:hypothetical protein